MKLESIKNIPQPLQSQLPDEALEVYREAYNRAWDEYDAGTELGQQNRESVAHRQGWAAVKREFEHNEEKGIWYRKGEEPEEVQEEGIVEKIKHTF